MRISSAVLLQGRWSEAVLIGIRMIVTIMMMMMMMMMKMKMKIITLLMIIIIIYNNNNNNNINNNININNKINIENDDNDDDVIIIIIMITIFEKSTIKNIKIANNETRDTNSTCCSSPSYGALYCPVDDEITCSGGSTPLSSRHTLVMASALSSVMMVCV